MTTMAGARGTKTKLVIMGVKCDVILHGTVSDSSPKLKDYATAGPHGRPLRQVSRAVAAEVDETPEGEAVPVQKASPLSVSETFPEKVQSMEERLRAAMSPTPQAAPLQGPTATLPPSVPTVDEGPGRLVQVLVETPGEGEKIDEMPALGKDEVRRGMRLADGTFIDLTAQLADIDERSKLETMEVVYTMDVSQVPRNRVMGSYYVAFEKERDGDGSPGTLRVLFEAMRKARRVPVVKWTAKSKQSLGVVIADGRTDTLQVLKLAWAEDVREPGRKQLAHMAARVYEQEVDAMAELLLALGETKAHGLDTLRDDARGLREALEKRALDGELEEFEMPLVVEAPEDGGILEALQRSLAAVNA